MINIENHSSILSPRERAFDMAWFIIVTSCLSMGLGGIACTYGFRRMDRDRYFERTSILGWFWLILGVILIGGGGGLANFGWRIHDEEFSKYAMVESVYRELEINGGYFKHKLFKSDTTYLTARMLYPRFRNTSTVQAVTSRLMLPLSLKDTTLLNRMEKYATLIDEGNRKLDLADQFFLREKNQDSVISMRQRITSTPWFLQLRAIHDSLASVMHSQFPFLVDERKDILGIE